MTHKVDQTENRSGSVSEVMSAIDEIDGRRHLVIADIAGDDGWISMAQSRAPCLDGWR